MSSDSVPTSIKKIKERLEDQSFQQTLKGFSKTLQFSLPDIKEDYVFTLNDGKLSAFERKSLPDSNITITVSNSLLESIIDKSANAMTAYMTGKLKAKGSMDDLMRLQDLLS